LNSIDILDALRALSRSQMRFITVTDMCGALQLPEEECLGLLQEYVDRGLLRTTRSQRGEPYYWLTAQLSQE
jgi:hypothetical protein